MLKVFSISLQIGLMKDFEVVGNSEDVFLQENEFVVIVDVEVEKWQILVIFEMLICVVVELLEFFIIWKLFKGGDGLLKYYLKFLVYVDVNLEFEEFKMLI